MSVGLRDVPVAVVRSSNSFDGVLKALNLVEGDVRVVVGYRRRFLIKPNFVSAYNSLSATPVETVEALLEFIYSNFNVSEVIITETPAMGSFYNAIRNFGYDRLRQRYNVEFLDLSEFGYEVVTLRDEYGGIYKVQVSKALMDRGFVRISLCRAKTHDTVVVTLSIKNAVFGGIRKGDRASMHRGYLTINYNLAKIATMVMPDLGVVDGVVGMEGNGPVSGTAKSWGAVFASANLVNLDSLVAYAMGFNPEDIGYLYFLAKWGYGEIDVKRIRVVGDDVEHIKTRFKPHSLYHEQLSWKKHLDRVSQGNHL
jgi:uncharacterized protein (DUF362 family)